jgi:hypothetical protein
MKKFLVILAIGAFVACNDDGTTDSTTGDTATNTIDSSTVAPIDTSNRAGVDTSRASDTTLRK